MFRLVILLTAVAAGLTGCASNTAAATDSQQRMLEGVDPDLVLQQGAAILQREFGRVQVNAGARRVVTAPTEYSTQHESGTARDLYRGRSTMRRIATLDVTRRGENTLVRLRIDIERQDTNRQTVMQPQEHRLSDTPGQETPVDRDAATTHKQNTVWTKVRRDSVLERSILEELRDKVGRLTADEEPAEPRPAPADAPASAPAHP